MPSIESTLMMTAAQIAVQKNESIVKCTGVKLLSQEVSQSIAALIMTVNKPSVKKVTGKEISLTSGLIKALTTPKMRPINRKAKIEANVLFP